MRHCAVALLLLGFTIATFTQDSTDTAIRMVRALSGPSGKAVGTKFILDEIRNRFVYPQDNSLTVSFECTAPEGDYTLTAYWQDPEGRIAGISPDVKIETVNEDLNSYWVFMLSGNRASGIWTVELRVNGEPVGTHSFELVIPPPPPLPVVETPEMPSTNDLYRMGIQSLVWINKLDSTGQRIDTTSGFVVQKDTVMTAFQSIDAASSIEIVFADGTRAITDSIHASSRLEDWALVKVDTGDIPFLQLGTSDAIIVGEPAVVFSVGSGVSRTIGSVDVTGIGLIPGFGERIDINPQPPPRTIGSPLLDLYGKVIGILGGSLSPGIWTDHGKIELGMVSANRQSVLISATPVEGIPINEEHTVQSLRQLAAAGILTPPLVEVPMFDFGVVSDRVTNDLSYFPTTRFSRRSPQVVVNSVWKGLEEDEEGIVKMNIFDANNKLRSRFEPQPLKLKKGKKMQCQFSFSPGKLQAGPYRIDVYWNDQPVWRTSLFINE